MGVGSTAIPNASASPPRAVRKTNTRDLFVAVNGRASSTGRAGRWLADLRTTLGKLGARVDARITDSESELRDALQQSAGRRVVLVGGDGTLSAAANAGVDLSEVALIPAGRANNVARALRIPLDPADAARVAVQAPAHPLDLLRVEAGGKLRYAVEALSAGLQAEARSAYRAHNSGDLLAGALALAGALRRYRPYEVELFADGGELYNGQAAQVFLSNLPYFGFGFRVNPAANPNDGLMEAIVLPAASRTDALRLLAAARSGRHLRRSGVVVRRAASATLVAAMPLACDATPLGVSSAVVTMEPGRLTIASPWSR
jgi:diacylglycerol kinase family enzyme